MKEAVQPVEIAIVGPGRMGQLYARLIDESPLAHLVAVCGRSTATTQAVATTHNVPGYANGDYQAMLAAHPNIEAVIVAASEWAHIEPVLGALAAGKHVLVEKPMAVSAEAAAQMVQAAERAGVHLMVCHSLRFDLRFAAMRQAVAEGAVGEVLHIYARRHAGQIAVERVLGRFPLAYWLAPHDIDMMLWTNNSPVTKVMAYSRAGGKTREDFIIAVLTFANGVIGVLESSWGTPAVSGRLQTELFTVRGTAGAGAGGTFTVVLLVICGWPTCRAPGPATNSGVARPIRSAPGLPERLKRRMDSAPEMPGSSKVSESGGGMSSSPIRGSVSDSRSSGPGILPRGILDTSG